MLSPMPGLIERYRDRLPFGPEDPVVSLEEGLDPACPRSAAVRARGSRGVAEDRGRQPHWLVQGPGDDLRRVRGRREGAQAIVCASTGNTAASAAAYAARAGLRGVVIVPEGRIAAGKLAQALMHGAQVVALRGNFDQALVLVRELADRQPIALVNSVNEFRIEGQKTAAFEIAEALAGELDALCIPVGNAGNITAYWRGFKESGQRPRMLGFQAAGAAPLVLGAPVEHPETVASAIRIGNPARWEDAMDAMSASGGRSGRSPTSRSWTRTASWPRRRESSASRHRPPAWPGLLAHGAGDARRVVCVLTGHGLKDPQTALGSAAGGGALRGRSFPRSRKRY